MMPLVWLDIESYLNMTLKYSYLMDFPEVPTIAVRFDIHFSTL